MGEAFALTAIADEVLTDLRTGSNIQHSVATLLGQSIYSWLVGYDDTNDSERLSVYPVTLDPRSSGPRSERMPEAYHDLVDRIRKAKQRFESRSNPTPGSSHRSPVGEGGSGNRQSKRPVVPVSREKLARQIWQSKQRGENRDDTAAKTSKPQAPASDSSQEPVLKPGAVNESFLLPNSDGSDHEESVRRGLVDPEWPLPR